MCDVCVCVCMCLRVYVCVCLCVHICVYVRYACPETREHLVGIVFFFPLCGSEDWTQAVKLGSKCFYSLSRPDSSLL